MSRLHWCLWSCLALAPAVALAQAQTQDQASPAAALQARCAQLVAYWDRYAGSKGEGGGSMDMPRKSAVADCAAGRPEAGIRTLEDLLRRNGYTVPPPP
jgi:hypothetical protein